MTSLGRVAVKRLAQGLVRCLSQDGMDGPAQRGGEQAEQGNPVPGDHMSAGGSSFRMAAANFFAPASSPLSPCPGKYSSAAFAATSRIINHP